MAVLETNEKTPDETSTLETDVDCDKKSSQDLSPSPSGGDDSVELTSETSDIVAAAVEIAPEVKEEKVINDLPPGWTRKQISKAFRKNETIIVVQTPDGKQFDCQKKLNSYIARNKLNIYCTFCDTAVRLLHLLQQSPHSSSNCSRCGIACDFEP